MSHIPSTQLPSLALRRGAGAILPAPACRGLSPDERFVVGAIRQVVIGGVDAPEVEQVFFARCGKAGGPSVALLRNWLLTLAEYVRRKIAVGHRSRCCPSPDEIMMLAIIESSRRGDFTGAHAILAQLVHTKAIDPLAHGAEQLGEALLAAGISLRPVRFAGPANADDSRR